MWNVALFRSAADEWGPVERFTLEQSDPNIRAKIVRKMEHLANVGKKNAGRPLVDTVDGPLKELRVDKQIRLLFQWEDDIEWILFLEATRKKNGKIDPDIVERAKRHYQQWLKAKKAAAIGPLKKEVAGK